VWAAVPEAVAEAARGGALAREGKYELAIQHYKAALRLDSHLPGLYLNLGSLTSSPSGFRRRSRHSEEAVRADGSSFQARALLGMSYSVARAMPTLRAQLNWPPTHSPKTWNSGNTLAQSYLASGPLPGAEAEFQFLLSRDPKIPRLFISC